MWMDGLGMKQNRTNGLGFLLVGCFDLAPFTLSIFLCFFFLLLFVFMQRNCLLYTKIVFFYIRTQRWLVIQETLLTTKISEHRNSTSSIFSSVFTLVPPSLSLPLRFCQLYVPRSRLFVTDVGCSIYFNLSARNLFHSQPFQIIRPSKPGSRGSHTNTLLLHSKSLSLVEIQTTHTA